MTTQMRPPIPDSSSEGWGKRLSLTQPTGGRSHGRWKERQAGDQIVSAAPKNPGTEWSDTCKRRRSFGELPGW